MATPYSRLTDIDEKSTVVVLRIAFAFLLSATLLSLCAVLTYVKAGTPDQTYIAALSTIINAVALYHYYEIIKARTGASITVATEWRIAALRHSDWAVTMPLLILKLYALINNPDHDLILQSVDAAALCSTIMVLLGAFVRLGLEEMASVKNTTALNLVAGVGSYVVSFGILILLLVDLCLAYSDVDNTAIVYAFFLVWPCYGLTHAGACFFRQEINQAEDYYPKNLALTQDVVYAGLDVFSKAVFAWYTSSMAFNKSVLGS